MMDGIQSAGQKAALKTLYTSLTLLLVPLIAEAWYKANTKEWFSKIADYILPWIEKLCDWYNDMLDTMIDKGYGFFDYLPTIPVEEMKAGYLLVKTTNDTLNMVGGGVAAVGGGIIDAGEQVEDMVGNIPILGGITDGISDVAGQVIDDTATLVTDNPITDAVEATADKIVDTATDMATKVALKTVYTSLYLVICPIIAEVCYKLSRYALIKVPGKALLPLIEELCEWYNNKMDELDDQGYTFFGYLPPMPIDEMKTAYKVVKTANAGLEAAESAVGLNNDDE